jgi:hypothetical protein
MDGYLLYNNFLVKKDEKMSLNSITKLNSIAPGASTGGSGVIMFIMFLFIMGACVYFSWTRNTKLNVNPIAKVLYAIFAAFGGTIYLFFYLIFNMGITLPCVSIPQEE